MPSIDVYNQKGERKGTLQLNESVFGIPYNEPVIHRAVVAIENNMRQGTKSTLTRTEVRGGGRKPWRQKGTGRARQGSIRSPQWVKGGVVFAPKPRDFTSKVNKKARRLAFLSALSAKLADGDMIAVDAFNFDELKTRNMVAALEALKIDKRVMIVTAENDEKVLRCASNIPDVHITYADTLSVLDLVKNRKCLLTVDAIKRLEQNYGITEVE